MLHISNRDTPRSIYYAYFHSVMKYGIIQGTGTICLTVKKYLFYTRKLLEVWLV